MPQSTENSVGGSLNCSVYLHASAAHMHTHTYIYNAYKENKE